MTYRHAFICIWMEVFGHDALFYRPAIGILILGGPDTNGYGITATITSKDIMKKTMPTVQGVIGLPLEAIEPQLEETIK